MLQTIPHLRATAILGELSAAIPAATRSAAALVAAARRVLAGDRGSGARAHLPPGAPARPSGALGFHQRRRFRGDDCRRAVPLTALLPLPRHRITDLSTATVTVTRSATISVRTVLYTVPSRLIGCRLKVHIYDDRLVCYLGTTPVLTVGRRHFKRHGPRVRVVDYRHLMAERTQ